MASQQNSGQQAAGAPLEPLLISGALHRPRRLGMRITAADMKEEPLPAAAAGGSGGRKAGSGQGRSPVSLADLVASGLLAAGRGVISVTFKGRTFSADLAADGVIEYEGKRYPTATAFSIHCKRLITPGKQGDDGWRSCCYEGRPLEHFRAQYAQRVPGAGGARPAPQQQAQQQQAAVAAVPPPAAAVALPQRPARSRKKRRRGSDSESEEDRGEDAFGFEADEEAWGGAWQQQQQPQQAVQQAAGLGSPLMVNGALVVDLPPDAEVEGADRWVQCDRCQVWRMVPADNWPAVQDDPREEWYCEYAAGLWDVSQQPPHKPACSPGGGSGGGPGSGRRGRR